MATLKTITGKLTGPDGAGIACQVKAVLSQAVTVPGTQELVTTSARIYSDPTTGVFTLQLYANNDLTPNGTYYTVTAIGQVDNVPVVGSWIIIVPQTAGPFEISNLVTTPSPVNVPANGHVASLLVDGAVTFSAGPVSLPAQSIADAALSSKVVLTDTAQTLSGVKSFSAAPIFSAGFTVSANQIGAFGTGESGGGYSTFVSPQLMDIRAGTTGSPDTTALPLVKISRKMNLQAAQVAGVGTDEGAGFYVVTSVVSTGQVQASSIVGIARTASDYSSGGISADAGGIVGIGISTSTRVGIGGYFEGDANGVSSLASSAQFGIRNSTGSDHTINVTGFPNTGALWVASLGANRASAGLVFGNPAGSQMDYGIHWNAQVAGGKTGPTAAGDMRTDSTAPIGYLIQGTHSSAAMAVAAGSGTVVIGGVSAAFSPALLEVRATAGVQAGNPTAVISHPDATGDGSLRMRNGSGSSDYFAAGAAGHFMTGTIAGDTGILINSANKFWHVGPAGGFVLKVGQDNTIRVGNATALLDFNYAVTALGGGAAPTVGTIGGSGPATAAQNSWLKVNIAGTASYIPIWR